jgi:uncharacterized protein (DUF2147 family)
MRDYLKYKVMRSREFTMKKIILLLTALAMFLPVTLSAQIYNLEGFWHDPDKTTKVQIYQPYEDYFCGKIVWLKEPLVNGKPKLDMKNPDPTLRSRPLMDLVIIKGLVPAGKNKYENGTFYDYNTGNTYSTKAELTSQNTMKLRKYIGVSLMGHTETWTRTK